MNNANDITKILVVTNDGRADSKITDYLTSFLPQAQPEYVARLPDNPPAGTAGVFLNRTPLGAMPCGDYANIPIQRLVWSPSGNIISVKREERLSDLYSTR
jgi:hypothetical protein